MSYVRLSDLALVFEGASLVVRSQSAGRAARLPAPAVAVLAYCAEPRTREQVMAALGPQLVGLFDGLVDAGILVPPGEASHTAAFFHSFAGIEIHRRMLQDGRRVSAYAEAIARAVRPGMAVLDAGTGTGLLAALAARAGARVVYAVDNSDLLPLAAEVARASGMADVIRTVRGDFARVKTPEPVDVVVSETFGAFALAEGSVPDLLACVQNNLRPGGKVVPNGVALRVAPVGGDGPWSDTMAAFDDLPGISFAPLRDAVSGRGRVMDIPAPSLITPGATLAHLRYPSTDTPGGDLAFRGDGEMWCGFACWFDIFDDGMPMLGTGPDAPPTHWRQLYLPLPPRRWPGEITLSMTLLPAADDRRSLEVVASLPDGERRWRIR